MKLLLLFTLLPLIVFSYTVSGNSFISTSLILSSIHFDPVRNIKSLYLKEGYPFVDVSLEGSKITIVEEKLTTIIGASESVKNSIVTIIGKLPKFLTISDLQNVSFFLSRIKIPFVFKKNGDYLLLILNKKYKNIYFNSKKINTKNLYLFLETKKNSPCKKFFNFVSKDSNLYIVSEIQNILVKKSFFPSYSFPNCKSFVKAEVNMDLRNGWNFKLKKPDVAELSGSIFNYDISQVSLYYKFIYFKMNFDILNLAATSECGVIFPYIGFSFDTTGNFNFYINDYKNIFCGILDKNYVLFLNFSNFTIGYDNSFYIGLRYKEKSFLLGYNFEKRNVLFKIFDWRR